MSGPLYASSVDRLGKDFVDHNIEIWTKMLVVLDSGEGVARPGDAIFVCETAHRIGPILWHEDLGCYCAPATISPSTLSKTVNGSCAVDKPFPLRDDQWGACRFARCSHHENF